MAKAKRKRSRGLIRALRLGLERAHATQEPFFCFRMEELEIKYTEAQRNKMNDAQAKIYEAEELVKTVFKDLIGEAIVTEIRNGEWKDA